MNQKTRTAEGLACVLQHAVPDATITVEEFHPVWVAVDDAEPMPLGHHCVLGGGFFGRSHCVRVIIAPTTASSIRSLMPGQAMHEDVMHLMRCYLDYEAKAIIDMHVPPDLMPAPVLESNTVSLGYTTLLAYDDTPSRDMTIRIQLGAWNVPSRS